MNKISHIKSLNPFAGISYSGFVSYCVPIRNIADYSPFGVQLDGRTISMDSYRYAFNGMEGDSEFKGQGNSYTTEFRQYDARLGRWLSLDPMMAKFPWQSPYVAFDNNPIFFVDNDGCESKDSGKLSKRQIKKIERQAKMVQLKSKKLSEKESKQAVKYQEKHGGDIIDWEDSHGNSRHSVQSPSEDGISIKRFNINSWKNLNFKTDYLVNKMSKALNINGVSSSHLDLIGTTYGVSFIGEDLFVHTQFISTIYLPYGKDKGWHEMVSTGTKLYGLNYELSSGVIYGLYMGRSNEVTLNSLSGSGYQAGGDILGGANAWWTYKNNGSVGWAGSTITVGWAIGGSAGETDTKINW